MESNEIYTNTNINWQTIIIIKVKMDFATVESIKKTNLMTALTFSLKFNYQDYSDREVNKISYCDNILRISTKTLVISFYHFARIPNSNLDFWGEYWYANIFKILKWYVNVINSIKFKYWWSDFDINFRPFLIGQLLIKRSKNFLTRTVRNLSIE